MGVQFGEYLESKNFLFQSDQVTYLEKPIILMFLKLTDPLTTD